MCTLAQRELPVEAFVIILIMCTREIHQCKYRNCTEQPKHIVIQYVFKDCPKKGIPECPGFVDNSSFGMSTIHGGICPKC